MRHMAPELLVLLFLLGMSAVILMTYLASRQEARRHFPSGPMLRRHSTGKLLEQRPSMERSPRFSYEEEGRETATDRAPVGALAWESVQATAGQGRATDRAATGDQA